MEPIQTRNHKTRILTESAVMIALATVLSMLKIYEAPLGGSVTLFSMTPILLLSFRHGIRWGIGSAFVYSITQLLLGLGTVAYVPTARGIVLCVLLDYVLAFSALGIAGLFRLKEDMTMRQKTIAVLCGTAFACLLRFVCHLLSGSVVWYEITKTGDWNEYVHKVGMWTYSLVYNLQYMGPETALTLAATPAMVAVLKLVPKMHFGNFKMK